MVLRLPVKLYLVKDKFKLESAFEQKLMNQSEKLNSQSLYGKREEAIQALLALGYSSSDAYKIISQIEITEDMDTEEILKLCLKRL